MRLFNPLALIATIPVPDGEPEPEETSIGVELAAGNEILAGQKPIQKLRVLAVPL